MFGGIHEANTMARIGETRRLRQELDFDRAGQSLVHLFPALWPVGAVFRQELAPAGHRTDPVTSDHRDWDRPWQDAKDADHFIDPEERIRIAMARQ